MQRKNDRNPGREPRSQEGMNLRRMGWLVGSEVGESSWKMSLYMNNILAVLRTTGKLKTMYSAPHVVKVCWAVGQIQRAKS